MLLKLKKKKKIYKNKNKFNPIPVHLFLQATL